MWSLKHCCHKAEPALISATGKAFVLVLSHRNDFPIGSGGLPASTVLQVTVSVGKLQYHQALIFLFLQEVLGWETKQQNHKLIPIYFTCELQFGSKAYGIFNSHKFSTSEMPGSFADWSQLMNLSFPLIPTEGGREHLHKSVS